MKRIYNVKKRNKYDLGGKYGIGYDSNGKEFYFDLEDYDKIKDGNWLISRGYARWDKILMHQLIMDYDKDCELVIDHINRIRYDNRKENLRLVKYVENCINVSKQSNNTSGIIGVSWDKQRQRWMALIRVDRKLIKIGNYHNKEDAIKSRLQAELKYFGKDFAPQRDLFDKYKIENQNRKTCTNM